MPEQTYRFSPLERRALLLGLGPAQAVVAAVAVVLATAVVTAAPGGEGMAGAVGIGTVALALCLPVRGRPATCWAALATAFLSRAGKKVGPPPGHLRASASGGGARPGPARSRLVPGMYLSELAQKADDGPVGLLWDQRAGTAAALLRCRGGAFCLLDGPDKERALAGWAAVLEAISGQGGSVARFQWCQMALPANGEALLAHLRRAGDSASPGLRQHQSLLEAAGNRFWRHETVLSVSVQCRGRRGRLSPEGERLLRNEVRSLRCQLRDNGLVCEGVLDGYGVARTLGGYLVGGPAPDGLGSGPPWPLAVEERWSEVRADALWHRTYWVAEWPRTEVGPDFLAPLLIGRGRRCFSVVMAPVPPEKAQRDAESSRTAQIADAHLRAQGGFLETAQHRRQAEAVEGREAQLADGRGAYRFSGYISISHPEMDGLVAACADLERAAGAARLSLRLLYGQQREALTWALPLARGI